MKQSFLILSIIALFSCMGCSKMESSKGEITIKPMGNYLLSKLTIRKVEDGVTGEKNYATETAIYSTTTFKVDPGEYYVFLKYQNLNTLVSGWWQTTSKNLITVKSGESWVVEYGYYGGKIKQD